MPATGFQSYYLNGYLYHAAPGSVVPPGATNVTTDTGTSSRNSTAAPSGLGGSQEGRGGGRIGSSGDIPGTQISAAAASSIGGSDAPASNSATSSSPGTGFGPSLGTGLIDAANSGAASAIGNGLSNAAGQVANRILPGTGYLVTPIFHGLGSLAHAVVTGIGHLFGGHSSTGLYSPNPADANGSGWRDSATGSSSSSSGTEGWRESASGGDTSGGDISGGDSPGMDGGVPAEPLPASEGSSNDIGTDPLPPDNFGGGDSTGLGGSGDATSSTGTADDVPDEEDPETASST
ncbi:MAG: hypothetical protein ABI162_07055 [Luteolibacter sp.]